MKKLSILLSMLMIVGMFGTVASAAGTTDAKHVLSVDKTTVTVGDIVTVTVGIEGDTTLPIFGTAKACPTWDAEYFEYVDGSAEVDSSTFGLTNATTVSTSQLANGYITYQQTMASSENKTITGDYTFGTFQLKAIKATDTTAAISFNSATATNYGTTASNRAAADETATVAITIKAASTGGSVNATQSGSTFTDAADAKAVAYVAELDSSASGKTGRWYATIGTTPMKTIATFTLPNISAENVKLGLVYKGAETVSDVVFKWE